jgi:hypothetical protein
MEYIEEVLGTCWGTHYKLGEHVGNPLGTPWEQKKNLGPWVEVNHELWVYIKSELIRTSDLVLNFEMCLHHSTPWKTIGIPTIIYNKCFNSNLALEHISNQFWWHFFPKSHWVCEKKKFRKKLTMQNFAPKRKKSLLPMY